MALSNIFKEPRREITETLVALSIVLPVAAGFLYADYHFACRFSIATGDPRHADVLFWLGMFIGFLAGLMVLMMAVFAAVATHALGESICNRLQEAGIQLRPRQRH